MTVFDPTELDVIWERNGGDRNARVIAVSVALAESGGDSTAISPSSDYGLWQINSIHFGTVGIDSGNWSDVDVNARAAIAISSNGSNWGPWCTCWTDPANNCGHYLGPYPQAGSPAADEQNRVAQILGNAGQLPPLPPSAGPIDEANAAWSSLQNMFHSWAPLSWNQIKAVELAVKGLR